MRALLLFPPGWSVTTGSPHLALPLLKAALEQYGFEARCRDLNWEAAHTFDALITERAAVAACEIGGLAAMNEPYFAVEDRLMAEASRCGGRWNAQLGFEYNDKPQDAPETAFTAVARPSPYDVIFDRLIDQIGSGEPDLVGLSIAATQQIVPALQLCRRLRTAGYGGPIVWGGNTVSRLISAFAASKVFDDVDALITYQGEMPLLALCRAVEAGTSFASVPNLVWRDADGVRDNGQSTALAPDCLPTPNYDDLHVGQYAGANHLSLVAARGCYYGKCSFCAIPYGWGVGGYGGARSPSNTLEDMRRLSERYGMKRFKFVDEALSPRFMRALASQIRESGEAFEWEGYTRLEGAWSDPAFVDLVAEGGFRKGYFGLELVGDAADRQPLAKNDQPDPSRLLELCASAGVRVHLFCMFGYPGTTIADAVRTLDFVLDRRDQIDTADFFPWTLARHTQAPDIRPLDMDRRAWALEFEHEPTADGVLSSQEIRDLAAACEERVWEAAPVLLHPVHRLVSPWRAPVAYQASPFAPSVALG